MEIFLEITKSLLIPQVVAGLLGGFLGALINFNVKVYGWRLSILFMLGSIIGAGAASEYAYSYGLELVLLHCSLGLLVGMVGNAALDAVNLAAPEHVRNIVNGTGEGIVYKIRKYLPNGKHEEK